jgi:hypothetical protein
LLTFEPIASSSIAAMSLRRAVVSSSRGNQVKA